MNIDFFSNVTYRKHHSDREFILEHLTTALTFISNTSLPVTQKGVAQVSGLDKNEVRYWWPELTAKSQRLNFRCSIIERTLLEAKSAKAELSQTKFLLRSTKKTRILVLPKAELKSLNIELNRIGCNLNQIAKHVNTYKNEADSIVILAALLGIEQELRTLNRKGLLEEDEVDPYANQIF